MAACPWSAILICAALAAAFAAELQFQVTPDDERKGQYDVAFSQHPNQKNDVGGACRNNGHCRPHLCCLLARDSTRTCQPLSRIGENCTDAEVKGGAYPFHCPCLQGLCAGNRVCLPSSSQGQRPVTSGNRQTPQLSRL